MRTLAILTNGGDTCALNASIKSIRDHAYREGYKKIYGVRRGYQGLLDGDLTDITHMGIDVCIGGSCLGSLRESPTRKVGENMYEADEERCKAMSKCLADFNVNVLVVIGGDGTLQATKIFQEWVQSKRGTRNFHQFEIIGFLKTIDNDIRTHTFFQGIEVALCPGFPSAVKKIVSTVEDLRVTASTAQRAFAVETMGRDAGWLAASATFGGSEILLVPELIMLYQGLYPERIKTDKEVIRRKNAKRSSKHRKNKEETFEKMAISNMILTNLTDLLISYYTKNQNVLIAVAEGFEPTVDFEDLGKFVETIQNLYGNRKKVGATELVAMIVAPALNYYFWCFSRLGECGSEGQGFLLSKVLTLLKREILREVHEKLYESLIKEVNHPLANWNILANLERSFKLIYDEKIPEENLDNFTMSQIAKDAAKESGDKKRKKVKAEAVGSNDYKVDWALSPLTPPPFNFEIRPHRTDYLPRSGPPSAYDYRLATVLGCMVGEMLRKKQYGMVPYLSEVVPYNELTLDKVKTVPITEITTLKFDSADYFDVNPHLHVSSRITDFFKTILSGPEDVSILSGPESMTKLVGKSNNSSETT